MADIHNFALRTERKLQKLDSVEGVSQTNKEIIRKFINECYAQRLSPGRICKILYFSIALAKMLQKDFDKTEKEDIKELVRKIESNPKNYTENTKKDFRVIIKKLYKWLEGDNEEYPDKVKWLKTTEKRNSKKLPSNLLNPEEIRSLVNAADNPRDKALVFVLYESGCRIGEMMGIRIKDVQFDQLGVRIMVSGKTGTRMVRVILSCDYLRYWLENHPDKANPDAPLWIGISNGNRGRVLGYQGVRKRLRKIADRAGIKKRVNPHIFRHSILTRFAKKISTPNLCVIAGWEQHSRQPSTYIHLSGDDADDAILGFHGVKKENGEEVIECPRCQKPNPPLTKYCSECGMPFNVQVVQKIEDERSKYDEMMSKLMENEDVKKAIMQALEERK